MLATTSTPAATRKPTPWPSVRPVAEPHPPCPAAHEVGTPRSSGELFHLGVVGTDVLERVDQHAAARAAHTDHPAGHAPRDLGRQVAPVDPAQLGERVAVD